jgi:DNA-binding transcriptional ArsR family regulator
LEIATAAASQSLRALEARGLLAARRQGGRVYYHQPIQSRQATLRPVLRALRAGFRRDVGFAETVFRAATAFTHPRRIEVYRTLVAGPNAERDIRAATRVSRFALVRHLTKLEARGLVRRERRQWVATQPADTFAAALARLAAS